MTDPSHIDLQGKVSLTDSQIKELQDALSKVAQDPAWKHRIRVLPPGSVITDDTIVGLIGLVGVKGFTGRLIHLGQWLNGSSWQNAKYEHSLVALGSGMAIEAQPGGALIYKLDQRWNHRDITWIKVADLNAEQRASLIAEANKLVGTPYSFLDYVAILAHRIHLPFPGLKKYVGSTDHMICSQLAAELYHRIGIDLFNDEWPGYITPSNFMDRYSGKS